MVVFQHETLCPDQAIDRIYKKLTKDPAEIARIASVVLSTTVSEQYVRNRIEVDIPRAQAQVAKLLLSPGIAQRTDAWYAARTTMITASDAAQALGKSKFGSARAYFMKKTYDPEPFNPLQPACMFGTRWEPISQELYARRHNTHIHEFGLLKHPSIPNIGASPDGISTEGTMLEIKTPWKRVIDGSVPDMYYHQVQIQLSVCELDCCDYFECKIVEFPSWEELLAAVAKRKHATEYGWCIQRRPDGLLPVYTYSPIAVAGGGKAPDPADLGPPPPTDLADGQGPFVEVHYWMFDLCNTVRIPRDDDFLATRFQELQRVWEKVQAYKEDRELYDREINPKREKANAEAITGYSFLDVTV